MLVPIANTPRDYAWGGVDAISGLLGTPPTGGPEAELWLGTHPGSPARLVADGRPLGDVAGPLPFLMKVLAAGAPLSLQVHPNARQAAAGHARETAAGVPVDGPERVYRDPHEKTELILAVSERFEAQAGFRAVAEVRADLRRLGDASAAGLAAALDALDARLGSDAVVGRAFLWLLSDEPEALAAVAALRSALAARPDDFPVQAGLAEHYPEDAGVVASLLLNNVVLRRGEALAIAPGTIHGYLSGIGIELLTASDNVVRGGLTPKHIDRAELAALLEVAAAAPQRITGVVEAGGGTAFIPPSAGERPPFRLDRIEADARLEPGGPAILLCVAGGFEVRGAGSEARLERGGALYASADEGALDITGAGELYAAR